MARPTSGENRDMGALGTNHRARQGYGANPYRHKLLYILQGNGAVAFYVRIQEDGVMRRSGVALPPSYYLSGQAISPRQHPQRKKRKKEKKRTNAHGVNRVNHLMAAGLAIRNLIGSMK